MFRARSMLLGCLLSTSVIMVTTSNASDDVAMYEVTITNVMHQNTLARAMVATHKSGMSFFKVGDEPDDELAWLAEAGNGNPMAAKLLLNPDVSDAQVAAEGTPAGHSTTIVVKASKNMKNISVGTMIGKSNDAFAGLRDMPLPKGKAVVTYTADGYDAGTETNAESNETVPACGGGSAAYSPDDAGEGFIHVSNGIRGIGCLNAAEQDWKNPVAYITIKRIDNE